MISDLPSLTIEQIRDWSDEQSFQRGERYFRNGAIRFPRRQGQVLMAECSGSRPKPYHVWVTLGSQGILGGQCFCPVGGGGRCKHVVALLLTWLDNPNAFVQVGSSQVIPLEQRSKDELIALIHKMLACAPDLRRLLELPIPRGPASPPLDERLIRRQVGQAFSSAGDEWDAARDVARELDLWIDLGKEYARQEDWRNATIIFENVIEGVLDEYATVHDDEGDLIAIVNDCVDGLGECLDATTDPEQREAILRTLFETHAWDLDHGGMEIGPEVAEIIATRATREERQAIVSWARAIMPENKSWERQELGRFLLDLQQDMLDDESYLRICRETGRTYELVERLLTLRRTQEALDVTRSLSGWALFSVVELFVKHGDEDLIIPLAREQVSQGQDERFAIWLKNRLLERGDLDEALSLAEWLFLMGREMSYSELRSLAQRAGKWDEVHARILKSLASAHAYLRLTRIYLEDGEVGRALETFAQVQKDPWHQGTALLEVAQAAEQDYPQDAISLYVAEAKRIIKARSRGEYSRAVACLARVRALYERLNQTGAWQQFITELRQETLRLRALRAEMDEANL